VIGCRRAALLLTCTLVSCASHGDASAVTVDVSGPEGQPIAASNSLDVLSVEAVVNGAQGTLIVDTGSPVVVLDPSAFAHASLPDGAGTVDAVALGALAFTSQYVVGAELITSPDPTVPLDGSLGCGILCAFAVSFDYRGSTVTLGPSSPPANVASIVRTPFSRLGGGLSTIAGVPGTVSLPASRIVIGVTVEGHAETFVVDSGSSLVTLRVAAFNLLLADGRAHIDNVGTAVGSENATSGVTRLRSCAIGTEEIDGLVASAGSALEPALDDVSAEIGEPIDGIVGGSFLRSFYVTVDYPDSALLLRRYTAGAPTFDGFDRVGVGITPATGSGLATVSEVFAGTDAATQGVAVGDEVVRIDGHALAGLGATAVDALLSGNVGATKSVTFGTAATLSMKTVSITVDDILPL
jgi:hypothetical protein